MNLNQIFSMLARMVMRSAVRTGVNYVARRGKPDAEMTPEERKQARSAKGLAGKAQKAARLGRRFLR